MRRLSQWLSRAQHEPAFVPFATVSAVALCMLVLVAVPLTMDRLGVQTLPDLEREPCRPVCAPYRAAYVDPWGDCVCDITREVRPWPTD